MRFKKDKSINMSVPRERELHGVRIYKLPIARYIAVLREAENLPSLLLGEIYPEIDNAAELIDKLTKLDREEILSLIGRLLTTVPEQICHILSELLDIQLERLLDVDCQNALSLNELLDIIIAFIEINDMSGFFRSVQSLKNKLTAQTAATASIGYNGGLQSHKA